MYQKVVCSCYLRGCSTAQMTLPCDGNACFAGSETRDVIDDGTAEALIVRADLDRQIESIRASVDLQVLSTGNNPTKMNVVRS